jgi:hypothetical protein
MLLMKRGGLDCFHQELSFMNFIFQFCYRLWSEVWSEVIFIFIFIFLVTNEIVRISIGLNYLRYLK